MKKFVIIGFIWLLTACSNEGNRNQALINVFMVDAPGDFDAAIIEILGVEVSVSGGRTGESVLTYFLPNLSSNRQVNVTALIGGEQFLIGRDEVNVGQLIEMKLILGSNNLVRKAGASIPLRLESPISQEPSIQTNFILTAGISHDLFIDFDIQQSISGQASEEFILNPVLRAFSSSNTGTVSGVIRPAGAQAVLYAIQNRDTITSTISNRDNGQFQLRGLTGSYTIGILPFGDTFRRDSLLNIVVTPQTVTQAGNINLQPRN
ncbi:DUF4382 domain-containing protein [Mongoliitalea daihaiensis]|uniref:DUF4382 domain-containing protein n=1 Tax=Mongoliitalea daihaiensis TaxID=2782006 RepID=UPI001F1D1FC1|nr:DUF4382 domain-containing protein [Mongoliitalea daihaiensis]UJP66367.1 DUF4382 domain-containing protein [Mongoliitalea daihaiensis]